MIPAKKSLGQNFLKSQEALRAIVDAANLSASDVVLEVGPGKGALTRKLLEQAGKVIAVEKDARLVPVLKEEFSKEVSEGKLNVREADILELDTQALPHPYKLVANIPYYITGALLQKFFETEYQPERMVLMLQKEVADRIVARDGKESILSMSVRAYGAPKHVMTVKAKYFSPAPKVDSAVILISNISKKFFSDFSEQDFFSLIKAGFAHKRKMLVGNLSETYPRERLLAAFVASGVNEKARAEDLALDDWRKLLLALR